MKIAVIGAGNVGGTLGRKWAEGGHKVVFGVRDPRSEKSRQLVESIGRGVRAEAVPDAAAFGEILVYSTPWSATESALQQSGDLTGKIVIDATNPLADKRDEEMLAVGFNTSGGEMVASWAKGARVIKTLNQTGWENMSDPVYPAGASVMLVCGEDGEAKATVLQLVAELGFEAIDAGGLKIARLLEPFGMLWIHLATTQGMGRDRWAFQIARR